MIKLLNTNNLIKYIFENVTQEEIFAYYLKCTVDDILKSISSKAFKVRNTIRNEEHNSLSFIYRGRKLKVKDWANYLYSGDCFHLAAKALNKDINKKQDFIYVLYDIIDKVIHKNVNDENEENYIVHTYEEEEKQELVIPFKISFETREFTNVDLSRFNNWGLRYDTLKLNKVYAVERAYFKDRLVYYNKFNDPCYAYYLGIDTLSKIEIYELYFPFRDRTKRHWTNNIFPIKYISEIKSGGLALIITKSRKDCLLLRQILIYLKLDTYIKVTQFHSESTILDEQFASFLSSIYDYVFTLNDFDRTGKLSSYTHKKLYKFIPLYFTNGSINTIDYFEGKEGKDITDYNKNFNLQKSIELVKNTIDYYKNKLL